LALISFSLIIDYGNPLVDYSSEPLHNGHLEDGRK